jgi:hypothetical protein
MHFVLLQTAENFRALCTGEMGVGKYTGKPLHYKGTPFHRIIPGFMCQVRNPTSRSNIQLSLSEFQPAGLPSSPSNRPSTLWWDFSKLELFEVWHSLLQICLTPCDLRPHYLVFLSFVYQALVSK